MAAVAEGTPARIRSVAVELFGARSYRGTSMREIAEGVGITKASLYYHFRSKAEILESLLGPLLDQLDQVVAEASERRGLAAVRKHLLEGSVDALLSNRRVLGLLFRDASVYGDEGLVLGNRVIAWMEEAQKLLAGPRAGWRGRVRATQALSALADPVSLFPDVSDADLRAELLRGANELLAA
jgi:AcrR family transcriptional regulator